MSDSLVSDDAALVRVNGARLYALRAGALYWPEEETLIVADLHFEKGSSFAVKGVMLPPYDTGATLTRLEALCRAVKPRRVIALGDSFHDGRAEVRFADEDAARLKALTGAHDWLWIAGNHDPAPPPSFGGCVAETWERGGLLLRHEPEAAPQPGEIAGHLHPCAAVRVRGRRLRHRCFVSDGSRLILPAFGAYTGGLNVLDEAFHTLFQGHDFHAWMIGGARIVPVKGRALVW
ncbi:ligase-associated DNA damage response endonuclease PdeM [Tepidicaulis sp. LMO-SS28]|uniref:ligase-associated DNA damage response endonuclease PdeM n=1 Tax=Tepidicaulis sp. LMO-SS28 TaxID=3447455 RepID=UPI003EE18005